MSERRTKMKPPRRLGEISDSSSSSSESTSSFSSGDEETDIRDLKPIKDYLNDRRQLAAQLFKSVKLEKIRRMLPQALKKMNLYDLEEWCGSELSGMSKRRIMSIISGQRMADSSDTEETDDSGPSLEIISDTEEWLTDDDVVIKEEDSITGKPKSKKNEDKVKGNTRPVSKEKGKKKPNPKAPKKSGNDCKSSDVIVKIEGEKPEQKEGETLLDLLELEMRARAIRALIRKEEDIIPEKSTAGTSSQKNSAATPAIINPAVSKYVVQEMEQISVALRQGSGVDDDVMLVIQPAPTIELLSSDSENGNEGEKEKEKNTQDESKRVNQRLENERETDKEEKNERVNERLANERENDEKNRIIVENKESDEHEHSEQSKRVNKRLENERGTETTHSTSTIGDEVVEIPDEEVKKEEGSPAASKKDEAEPVIAEIENSGMSPKKNADKVDKSPDRSLIKTTAEASNKTSEKTSGGTTGKAPEKSLEKIPDKEDTDKIKDQQEKVPDQPEKVNEKVSNEPENLANEDKKEKSPEKPKSPEKELEEGELTSDSEEEAPVVNVNIEKLKFNKRVKRRRHIRSKVHESSEESESSDQSKTSESEYEVSDKDTSKAKSKSRKKIRDRTRDVKATGSREKVNESTKDSAQYTIVKKEEEARSEVEAQKEELTNQNILKKAKEDAEKDMEEIIDLDDYSDDMHDLENSEKSKSGESKKLGDKAAPERSAEQSEPAETWATRYCNTDDVQNVIKESKIHSEIRKRLRERQRIYKLNFPNASAGSGSTNDIKAEEEKQKPLGSVEEYLALKAASAAAESALNEKTEVLPEKSRRSGRRKDMSHRSKLHPSKRRSKSDKKSAKDVSTRKRRERDMAAGNSEARPD